MRRVGPAAVATLLVLLQAGCGGPAVEAVRAPADVDGLAELLAAGGVDASVFDAGSLVVKRQWLQVMIFVEDDGESLQAVFPHTGHPGPVDPELIDRWNSTRRFGRAYLGDDGRPVLASDLLLGAGVGPDAVVQWSRLVLDMAQVFAAEVWPVPVPATDPVNE